MSIVPTQIPVSTSVPALTLAAGTVGGVAIANSIDPVNDYALIYTASATATQGINRNTLLGISSQPLGKTDVQTGISNKTFVAPVLGAATATSINGLILTSSTGTISITNGKTLAVSNSLTLAGTDSTTMTFPGSSDTVMTLAATQTGTNKTFTSPAIGTSILDTNGNNLFAITATASAVNYLTYKNATTTTAPTLTATGSDTNINLALAAKGTGFIQATPPVWQYLGYAQITGNISTSSTSFVAATGITKTVTVPSGATAVKITIGAGAINVSGQSDIWSLALYKDGTPIQQWYRNQDVAGYNIPLNVMYIDQSPTAGSHTYALYYGNNAGTTTIGAGTTSTSLSTPGPASILVECC